MLSVMQTTCPPENLSSKSLFPLLLMGLNQCLLRTVREDKEQNTSPSNTREEKAAIWLTDYLSRQLLTAHPVSVPTFTLSLTLYWDRVVI